MAASFISSHHGGGWRYVFHIPVDVRRLFICQKPGKHFGKPMAAFRRYIRRCPRSEAEAIARVWAVQDREALLQARELPQKFQLAVADRGGLLADHGPPPKEGLRLVGSSDPVGDVVRAKVRSLQVELKERKVAAVDAPSVSWDALFDRWQHQTGARSTANHKGTIKTARGFFGDVDCRQLTREDFIRFREHVLEQGKSRQTIKDHLTRLHSMYGAAAKDGAAENPFRDLANPVDVSIPGKDEPRKDGALKVFTPPEVLKILNTAKAIKFGPSYRGRAGLIPGGDIKMVWGLKLLAYTGMRPREVFQLQGGDVQLSYNGVKFLWVTHNDAVSHKKHPEKTVKNDEPRMVPLHPELFGFFDFAQGFAKDEFIFSEFKHDDAKGRTRWLVNQFGAFLRDECKIVDGGRDLKLYSLRHTFKTMMRNALQDVDASYWIDRIQGHNKNVSARYGGGVEELPRMAEYVSRVSYK
jgi:integrase